MIGLQMDAISSTKIMKRRQQVARLKLTEQRIAALAKPARGGAMGLSQPSWRRSSGWFAGDEGGVSAGRSEDGQRDGPRQGIHEGLASRSYCMGLQRQTSGPAASNRPRAVSQHDKAHRRQQAT